jgi:hypothetical protein
MNEKGSKQVKMVGLDDMGQITALLACTKSGKLLPPQLIYAGKTDTCHPKVTSPEKWDITHTKSHWSNDDRESMIRYVEKVLLPYVESVRDSLLITQHDQMALALAIFDVFKAHRSDKLLALHKKSCIAVVFVPASCTDKLQPLDQTINKKYKEELRKEFQMWFANMVAKKLSNKKDNDEICERTADIPC